MSGMRRDLAPNIAEHPPTTKTVPTNLRKYEQMATILRKHFSESGGITWIGLARENEQRTSRMRDKAGVGRHLLPWIRRFFSDLERAEAADFYRRIGALGRTFMDIETEAFALPT
jgi:hypothetical protein